MCKYFNGTKPTTFTARIKPEVYDQVRKLAVSQGRSINYIMNMLLAGDKS